MDLKEIIQEINKADGKKVYVSGPIGLKEVDEMIDSGEFTEIVNDGLYEKKITLHGLRDYLEKYGELLCCDFGVISYDEESERFKLYITSVYSKGPYKLKKYVDVISNGEWFERFKLDTVLTFPGALEMDMISYELQGKFIVRLVFELLNEYIDESAVGEAEPDSYIDKVYGLFD